jgi:hypothetical protein
MADHNEEMTRPQVAAAVLDVAVTADLRTAVDTSTLIR